MLMRMPDRSVIKLGETPSSRLKRWWPNNGAAGPSEIKSSLRLITGVFRYATDYTSKALGHKRELNLQLATATVGIRGTDFWSMTDAEHDAVCVFDGRWPWSARATRHFLDQARRLLGGLHRSARKARRPGHARSAGQVHWPGRNATRAAASCCKAGAGARWRVLPSVAEAAALRVRLQTAGYPAEMVPKTGRHEVRINQLATREDAEARAGPAAGHAGE
jgi:hypothetical protein